jgi:hypothetical protein
MRRATIAPVSPNKGDAPGGRRARHDPIATKAGSGFDVRVYLAHHATSFSPRSTTSAHRHTQTRELAP